MHYQGVYYKGKVKVNVAGKWEKGFKEPLWVIGSLKPSELLEQIRDRVYGGSKKWKLYSGLFILLKRKIRLAREAFAHVLDCAYMLFTRIVLGNVRTHV